MNTGLHSSDSSGRLQTGEQSAYARDFQQQGAHKWLPPESLSAWVKDFTAREHNTQQQQSGPRHVSSKGQVLKIYIMEVSEQACEI